MCAHVGAFPFQIALSIKVWDSQYLGEVEGTVLTVEDPGYVVGVEKESVFLPSDVGERWVCQEMAVQDPRASVR